MWAVHPLNVRFLEMQSIRTLPAQGWLSLCIILSVHMTVGDIFPFLFHVHVHSIIRKDPQRLTYNYVANGAYFI